MVKWERSFDMVMDRADKLKFYVASVQKDYGFTLANLEELWNLYKGFLIKNLDELQTTKKKSDLEILLLQNLYRNRNYADIKEPDPLRLTCPQFKILMMELFNVRDVELLNNLFNEICYDCTITSATDWDDTTKDKNGKFQLNTEIQEVKETISLEDFFEKMVFTMEGGFDHKISIIMELFCVMNGTKRIPYEKVTDLTERFFNRFYKIYEDAKNVADSMGFNTERFVSYSHFYKVVAEEPQHMDFLFRFSIGPYDDALADRNAKKKKIRDNELKNDLEAEMLKSKKKMIGYKQWTHK